MILQTISILYHLINFAPADPNLTYFKKIKKLCPVYPFPLQVVLQEVSV